MHTATQPLLERPPKVMQEACTHCTDNETTALCCCTRDSPHVPKQLCKILVQNNRQSNHARPQRGWNKNIKLDRTEMVCESLE
jgi:hypothetical protein